MPSSTEDVIGELTIETFLTFLGGRPDSEKWELIDGRAIQMLDEDYVIVTPRRRKKIGMTREAFLTFADAKPDERWQLLDGKPVAMVGSSGAHQVIMGALYRALYPLAKARGCMAYPGDMYVSHRDDDYFLGVPDVFVRCGPFDPKQRLVEDPVIVFEVLSPTTMPYDRGYKFECYSEIASVQQIVLIYQDGVRIESWTRVPGSTPGPADRWTMLALIRRDAHLHLPALEADIPIALIYEDVPELS